MTSRILPASAAVLCLLLPCSAARADPATAEALFREGRALLERGEVAAACDKLEASNAQDPSAGTLLNLAACRLKQGKTATAWAHFVAAERVALNQGRAEQALEAKRRARELERTLSTLTLLAPDAPPGMEVRRDGQLVQSASLGTAVPVDPGPLRIDVSAPGFESARLELTMGEASDRRRVTLPRLKKKPDQAAAAPMLNTARAPGHRNTALPWVIGGVGGGALVAGGVLGALALSSNASAVEACDAGDANGCRRYQDRRDAQALGSTIGVGVGALGVGVAVVWLMTRRAETSSSAWSYDGEVTPRGALVRMRVGF